MFCLFTTGMPCFVKGWSWNIHLVKATVNLLVACVRVMRLRICYCLVTKLCLILCHPRDYSPPGSSVHVISQSKTGVGCHFLLQRIFPTQGFNLYLLLDRWILYHWSTWNARVNLSWLLQGPRGEKKWGENRLRTISGSQECHLSGCNNIIPFNKAALRHFGLKTIFYA